jgi:hypothetical protein
MTRLKPSLLSTKLRTGFALLRESDDSVETDQSYFPFPNYMHEIKAPKTEGDLIDLRVTDIAYAANQRGLLNQSSILGYLLPEESTSEIGGLTRHKKRN